MRLLLCLYAMGTNIGIKAISQGDHGQSYQELLATRRRYMHADQLRAAIVDVTNATFRARLQHIWGEVTTTCASDSTQFGAWDENLMTETSFGRTRTVPTHAARRPTRTDTSHL